MKGRKPAIHPEQIVAAIVNFKDRVVIEFNRKKGKCFLCTMILYHSIQI